MNNYIAEFWHFRSRTGFVLLTKQILSICDYIDLVNYVEVKWHYESASIHREIHWLGIRHK